MPMFQRLCAVMLVLPCMAVTTAHAQEAVQGRWTNSYHDTSRLCETATLLPDGTIMAVDYSITKDWSFFVLSNDSWSIVDGPRIPVMVSSNTAPATQVLASTFDHGFAFKYHTAARLVVLRNSQWVQFSKPGGASIERVDVTGIGPGLKALAECVRDHPYSDPFSKPPVPPVDMAHIEELLR